MRFEKDLCANDEVLKAFTEAHWSSQKDADSNRYISFAP
jgi:hypothetical protein